MHARKDSVSFINILSGDNIAVSSIEHITQKKGKYCLRIYNDTLHLIETEKFQYYRCLIDSMFGIKVAQTLDLNQLLNLDGYYSASNLLIYKKIAYANSILFIPYGKYSKRNGMDKKAILRINLDNKKVTKILNYPSKYKSCDIRENYPSLEIVGNSLISVFKKDDRIAAININTGEETGYSSPTSFVNRYMCYDSDASSDLAYSSRYDLNDESNFNLIYNGNKYFLIKRLRKENKKDPVFCSVLVFNRDLKYIDTFFSGISVSPQMSFGYKNGIAIASFDLTKLIYYDFSGW